MEILVAITYNFCGSMIMACLVVKWVFKHAKTLITRHRHLI